MTTRAWKPDDEALVRVRVVPGDEPGRLHVQVAGGSFAAYVKPEQLIEPGVVIQATREDADTLALVAGEVTAFHPARPHQLITSIADAIRAQASDPEPPKRWTVDHRSDINRLLCIRDYGDPTGIWASDRKSADGLCAILNAAEPTP